jgi:MYXO-CTERM domain-containing protein
MAAVLAATAAAWSSAAHASYPAGVWLRATSVVVAPDAKSVVIDGAFMLYDGKTAEPYYGYTPPAYGFVHFFCPTGQEKQCELEWKELAQSVGAPKSECTGIGSQDVPTGTLHKPGDPLTKPDPYPIAMGVLPGFTPCGLLEQFMAQNEPPTGATTSGAGPSSGAGAAGPSSGAGPGTSGAGGGSSGATGGTGASSASGNPADDGNDPGDGEPEVYEEGCSIAGAPKAGWLAFGAAALAAFALGRRRSRRAR